MLNWAKKKALAPPVDMASSRDERNRPSKNPGSFLDLEDPEIRLVNLQDARSGQVGPGGAKYKVAHSTQTKQV